MKKVKKPRENKSRAIASSVAQKKNDGKQGFGFVDNRPSTITQKANRSPFPASKVFQQSVRDSPDTSSQPVAQLKPWQHDLGKFPGARIQYLHNGNIHLEGYAFNGEIYQSIPVYHGNTKVDVLRQIAGEIHNIMANTNQNDFLTRKALRSLRDNTDAPVNQSIAPPYANLRGNHLNTYSKNSDPALVKIAGNNWTDKHPYCSLLYVRQRKLWLPR